MSIDYKKLHPKLEAMLGVFLDRCKKAGFSLKITQGFRSNAEQAALYAQGRTKPGKIVTNARAGESTHNYGLAFDVAFNGADPYPSNASLWEKIGKIGEGVGLSWGGRWAGFPDKPHFEWTGGLSIKDLIAGKRPNEKPKQVFDPALATKFENKFLLSVDEGGKVYHVRGGKRYLVPAGMPMEEYITTNKLATGIKLADLNKIQEA